MGRPRRVGDDELVETIRGSLDPPSKPVVETEDLAEELPLGRDATLRQLKQAKDDPTVPISGLKPGGQGSWVWWIDDEEEAEPSAE